MGFAHLHVHTEYSFLDGLCRLDKLLERAKELGMTSIAITDHGAMYGIVEFYKKAKAAGIHPVIGCEVYVAAVSMHVIILDFLIIIGILLFLDLFFRFF